MRRGNGKRGEEKRGEEEKCQTIIDALRNGFSLLEFGVFFFFCTPVRFFFSAKRDSIEDNRLA